MNDRTLTISRLHPAATRPRRPLAAWSPRREPAPVPFLRLSGQWMVAAGFEIGERVRVEVEHGRLVVTPLDEDI